MSHAIVQFRGGEKSEGVTDFANAIGNKKLYKPFSFLLLWKEEVHGK